MRIMTFLLILSLFGPVSVMAESQLETASIVEQVYLRDSLFRSEIRDLTFSAESYSRKLKGNGEVKEVKKYHKTYFFKDSLFQAEFLDYYKNGEKQSDKELRKAVKEIKEKGRSRDATINTILPFYPAQRSDYLFNLIGVESVAGQTCYHLTVDCRLEDEELLEGDYWIETENFNPVLVRFHPSKLPGPIKQLDMEMTYAPIEEGYWLPERFHLYGRGKVMLFIKFYFEAEEIYSEHRINSGLSEDIFREESDEK